MAAKKKARAVAPSSNARAPVAPASLIAHLQESIADIVEDFGPIVRRTMLQSDGWFVNGKVFTLVSRQGRIVVRLTDPAAQNELLAVPGAAGWQIGSKAPMRGWLMVPESKHEDTRFLKTWLERAWTLTKTAPPAKKSAKKSAGVKTTGRKR